MPITRTPWIDDDGTGTTGTILNNAEKQALYNQIDGAITQPWTAVPFNAAHYVGTGGMTWTVTTAAILANYYCLSNRVLFWSIYVAWFAGGGSNVLAGTPATKVKILMPGGASAYGNQLLQVDFCSGVAGVAPLSGLYAQPTGNYIEILKQDQSNYALTDNPGIIATFVIQLV